tara:strand:- start:24 stop:629 length:606 start_codon:yes stop_codon:yes gene_type:complete
MLEPLIFYLSFGSPFSYIAAQQVEEIANKHDRSVCWRPVRLKMIIEKVYGKGKFSISPLKMSYFRKDSRRSAELYGLPFFAPEGTPPFDCDEAYACVYSFSDGDEVKLRNITLALISAVWSKGISVHNISQVVLALKQFHGSSALIKSCAESNYGLEHHNSVVSSAVEVGMFGAPWFYVDGESFWGHDRLDLIDKFLSINN